MKTKTFRSTPISTGRERPSGNSRATLPRQSRRGPTERRRNARFRKGAARRPDHLADGGHRRLPRTGGASHRRGHHPHGPGRLGDEKQPLNGTRPVGDIPLGTGESMTAVRIEERLSIRVERRSLARHRQIGHGRLRHVPERLPRLIGHHGAGQLPFDSYSNLFLCSV